MPSRVHVNLGERSYDIAIGREMVLSPSFPVKEGTAALVVSDSNVDKLYGDRCEQACRARGFETSRAHVPAGESSKDLAVLGDLYGKAVAAGLDRDACIVALGGGMVGDLAGFLAATYLRGVGLIQIPTTLLAMVDSSVGGKTAVNLPHGKNLVGAFHQPGDVVADLTTLSTLPDREYISGLAEVLKYGVIWDAPFFDELETRVEALLARDLDVLEPVVARCCEIKADVVAMDERESGVRAILNFGHTLAHAVESVSGYGTWLHGEAVAVGMAYAAELSVDVKGLPREDAQRVRGLLARLGLPVTPSKADGTVPWAGLREVMSTDKKARRGVPRFVLADRIGSVIIGCEVTEEALAEAYRRL